jgi:hypothetical protein
LRIIDVVNPWGEYYGEIPDTIPPIVYMDMVIQSGINFDAFGLQFRFGRDESGMHLRDMMQVSAVLDSFVPISRPLYITHVEVPGRDAAGDFAPDVAGFWHGNWDPNRQAEWLDDFYRIALSKTCIDAVMYTCFTDTKDGDLPDSGLLTAALEPKESYTALKRVHDRIFGR